MDIMHVPSGAELRRARAPPPPTKEQIWASNVRDLHRVMDVTKNIYLNLIHSNEAVLRVAIEVATGDGWPKIFKWDNNWFDDDSRRETFKNLVAICLPKALASVGLKAPPPPVASDEEKKLRKSLEAAQAELEKSRQEAAAMAQALQVVRADFEALRAEAAERQEANVRLAADCRRYRADIEQLQRDKETFETERRKFDEAMRGHAKALEDAKKLAVERQEEVVQLRGEVEALECRLQEAQALQAALKKESEEAALMATKRITDLQNENKRQAEELRTLEGLRATAEAAEARLREAERRAAAAETAAQAARDAEAAATAAAQRAAKDLAVAAAALKEANNKPAAPSQPAPTPTPAADLVAPKVSHVLKVDTKNKSAQTDAGELESLREECDRLRGEVEELRRKLRKMLEAAGEQGVPAEKIAAIVAKVGLQTNPWGGHSAIFDRLYTDAFDRVRRLEELREKYRAKEAPPPGLAFGPPLMQGVATATSPAAVPVSPASAAAALTAAASGRAFVAGSPMASAQQRGHVREGGARSFISGSPSLPSLGAGNHGLEEVRDWRLPVAGDSSAWRSSASLAAAWSGNAVKKMSSAAAIPNSTGTEVRKSLSLPTLVPAATVPGAALGSQARRAAQRPAARIL